MNPLDLEISCAEVQQRLKAPAENLVLIDCREQEEHALVAIAGARLLPMSELTTRVGEIEQHRQNPMVVYCHHGMRSAQVTAWLRDQGFTNVQSMAGGIDQWAVEVDPTLPRY